ncbi:hypothetical protein [Tropicimonas marinistellae]|uniref:hypothetical protein n=1 Tax=Tropicimonas marinistellae TaxID=1739787 RepID=UPI0008340A86|nr:hypothetical protein [Tropicimonas marinistellae]
MTGQDGRQKALRPWLKERLVVKVVDLAMSTTLMGGLLFLVVLLFKPVQERLEAIWETPKAVAEMRSDIGSVVAVVEDLSAEIRRLKQPEAVFEVSVFNTGPLRRAYCVEGESCRLGVKVRRLPEALPCKIQPSRTEWGFYNPRRDTYAPALRIDGAPGRNLESGWDIIEVELKIPYGLEPNAELVFTAYYTGCPGTLPGDPPLAYRSKGVSIPIRASAH